MARMDPPSGKPKTAIAISVRPGKMGPPGMEDDAPAPDGEPSGGKASVAEAHKVGAEQHCSDCKNYQAESGDCTKVEGYWDPDDACVRYFTPMGGEDESAEDPAEEAGETPAMESAEQPA